MRVIRALAAVFMLLVQASPASAQTGCAWLSDPDARLACFDRAARAPMAVQSQSTPPSGGACTRSSPCAGPRGGVYYFTASGNKRYLPR